MAKHPGTVTLNAFQGINNKVPPERLSLSEEGISFLAEALNVDIDSTGAIRLRPGQTKRYSGTGVHSMFATDYKVVFMENGSLKKLNLEDYTATTLATGYHPSSRVDYVEVNGEIYFSSLFDNGVIEVDDNVRSWGIPLLGQPILSESASGALRAGRYQVAVTFVTDSGRESGSSLATWIDINDSKGIALSGIPQTSDPGVTKVRVYCTTVNGTELYRVGEISNGTSTYTIQSLSGATVPLMTQFLQEAPKGDLVAFFNGVIFIANGKTLVHSEPFGYDWFNLGKNTFSFPDEITALMPVEDGILISSDRLYFLSGNKPENFRLVEREPFKVIKGTSTKIVGSDLRIENIPTGFKWVFTSDRGIGFAGNGGLVFNLTEDHVVLPESNEGVSIYRSDDGMNRYVTLLKDPESSRLHVSDQAVAEVIRNGITL